MAGGSRQELELQETPRLCPRCSNKDDGRPQGRDVRARITLRMDLLERGLHAGLVGDAKAEGAAREGRDISGGEEEDEAVAWSNHDTLLSGKIRQAVRRATDREGGGGLFPDDQCTKTGQPVAYFLWEKQPDMCPPPVENLIGAALEEYEEVPETVHLDFTEDNVMWVASKLSGTSGTLGVEAIELLNWLLCFGCASEELRVVISRLGD